MNGEFFCHGCCLHKPKIHLSQAKGKALCNYCEFQIRERKKKEAQCAPIHKKRIRL